MEQKPKYTYEEIFQRNIGVFTKEEQERIRNLKEYVGVTISNNLVYWF